MKYLLKELLQKVTDLENNQKPKEEDIAKFQSSGCITAKELTPSQIIQAIKVKYKKVKKENQKLKDRIINNEYLS